MPEPFPEGTAHNAPDDLIEAISADAAALAAWANLTPLGRNEYLCWIDDAKKTATRARRIARAVDEIVDGKRRPCCWQGCIHRTDKAPGRWQQAVLIDQVAKSK